MENINIASFSEANTATVKGIWQYDFGQILRIEGLGLPDAVEVHFSLQKTGGEIALTRQQATETTSRAKTVDPLHTTLWMIPL